MGKGRGKKNDKNVEIGSSMICIPYTIEVLQTLLYTSNSVANINVITKNVYFDTLSREKVLYFNNYNLYNVVIYQNFFDFIIEGFIHQPNILNNRTF